jgi:hypothetical protein
MGARGRTNRFNEAAALRPRRVVRHAMVWRPRRRPGK